MSKWVYVFGNGKAEGRAEMADRLGGKGANLAEMSALGLPVPPGFTITTELCAWRGDDGRRNDRHYPDGLVEQVKTGLRHMEAIMGTTFGNARNPLLISVRSGGRASMPGMMDSILNLGLNDDVVHGLIHSSGDARFGWDSYRRFIQMYASVALGVANHLFEDQLDILKADRGHHCDGDLDADDWQELTRRYKQLTLEQRGAPFPEDPFDQLWGAVDAVVASWTSRRAISYRRLNRIPDSWGTAVNVQAMVFGNMGRDCATGVAFTRDPSTGENGLYGEYLIDAQGEDVVAGVRTPQSLTVARHCDEGHAALPPMETAMPKPFAELKRVGRLLEQRYADMQDMEFTVQSGKLWMLQTRSGKRSAAAALKIAVDMVGEGLLTEDEAVMRVDPEQLHQLLHPTLDDAATGTEIASGLPASPGAACGEAVFTASAAQELAQRGGKAILVRAETSPEDIDGMHAAEGVLTSRGGMTSHAAVVARGMGRPCVVGAGSIHIDAAAGTFTIGSHVVRTGDVITIDGARGAVFLGEVAMHRPALTDDFTCLMGWADSKRRLRVCANAETPTDARAARAFGAEGIGLCRTEHMFFAPERLIHMRRMIVAADSQGRQAALSELAPHQRADFVELLTIMDGLPTTIRLLDPPLHEFLPRTDDEVAEVATAAGVGADAVRASAASLSEANPMLGRRGCRLGVTCPEIYHMQARAIFEAAIEVTGADNARVNLEIMIPLVATHAEMDLMAAVVDQAANDVFAAAGRCVAYQVGVMIELPRAALRAGDIARSARFFSFGTNDLTQTTLGVSRDDAAQFLDEYLSKGIYPRDPFSSLDCDGVGELIKIAIERGRAVRPDLKLGVCGEHGGDPDSIAFCEAVGLDYVSCSPYRIPIARLAAAQAALRVKGKNERAGYGGTKDASVPAVDRMN